MSIPGPSSEESSVWSWRKPPEAALPEQAKKSLRLGIGNLKTLDGELLLRLHSIQARRDLLHVGVDEPG
jgi:hypothetical protein